MHLHYGATGSNATEHDKIRRYQVRALLAWLGSQATTYPDQIVLGDLNANYKPSNPNNGGTRTIQLFLDGGFDRAPDVAAVTDDVGGTYIDWHTTRTPYAFDHFFTTGNVDTAYYTVIDNPIDVNDRYPSDHLPIVARFCLR